jgi:membrane protein
LSRILRARAASMGLLATLGFLLVVSLAASAAVTALGDRLNEALPFGAMVASAINTLISIGLITLMFAAVYKVLPDRVPEWHDVLLGAFVTAALSVAGKSPIGWYLGSRAITTTYGAAGSLVVLLLWVYYSVQIFLLGAEFTKVFANRHGSRKDNPVPET